MSIEKYVIGGQTADPSYEPMSDISPNRALLALKLTDKPAGKPEIVYDLKNIDEVFEYFKPSVEIEFNNENGPVSQAFHFRSLEDFGIRGLTAQSELLKDLSFKKEIFEKIARLVKANRSLNYALGDKNSKEALLNSLIALRKDLEQADR